MKLIHSKTGNDVNLDGILYTKTFSLKVKGIRNNGLVLCEIVGNIKYPVGNRKYFSPSELGLVLIN